MKKINIHSIVDVITNSSTVIYTYQNCKEEAKELLQEILNLIAVEDKSIDDLFVIETFIEDEEHYNYYLEDYTDIPYTDERIENIIERIMDGEIEKPEWMVEAEDYFNKNRSTLYIRARDKKYNHLAKKMIAFLNAPYSTESYE